MYQGLYYSSDVSEWLSNLSEKNAKTDEPKMKDSWEHTKTDI